MTKLTLQEQMLKAGLVSSKKAAKVQRTAKKSRVQAREAREAVEENKKAQIERDKQLSDELARNIQSYDDIFRRGFADMLNRGEDGIKADTAYKLSDNNEFEELKEEE